MEKLKKHPLIVGTALLTLSGLISRTIGFVYRIYLSRLVGAEGMGIYQILNPVLAIAFSLTAAGYQTAISKLVAEKSAGQKSTSYSPLIAGILITLPLSLLCTWALYIFSDYIAATFLGEPSTAGMLRMLAFSIPFSSVHSCINGHFYGLKSRLPCLCPNHGTNHPSGQCLPVKSAFSVPGTRTFRILRGTGSGYWRVFFPSGVPGHLLV